MKQLRLFDHLLDTVTPVNNLTQSFPVLKSYNVKAEQLTDEPFKGSCCLKITILLPSTSEIIIPAVLGIPSLAAFEVAKDAGFATGYFCLPVNIFEDAEEEMPRQHY